MQLVATLLLCGDLLRFLSIYLKFKTKIKIIALSRKVRSICKTTYLDFGCIHYYDFMKMPESLHKYKFRLKIDFIFCGREFRLVLNKRKNIISISYDKKSFTDFGIIVTTLMKIFCYSQYNIKSVYSHDLYDIIYDIKINDNVSDIVNKNPTNLNKSMAIQLKDAKNEIKSLTHELDMKNSIIDELINDKRELIKDKRQLQKMLKMQDD